MGILSRKIKTAEFGSAAPVRAAAGASQIGNFLNYTSGTVEQRALSIPTLSRAHDLIASMIGSMEFKHYTKQWTGEDYEEIYVPNESWMDRPDPKVTRQFILSNTFSDLYLYGRAFWYVTTRYSTGYPASFTWLPAANISTPNQQGPQFFGPPDEIEFNGLMLETQNVITFLSPIQGLAYTGARAINIAQHLDSAADRYASLETVPGYLQQKGGETMSGDELGELASAWAAARKTNAIGALNDYVEFKEFSKDPGESIDKLRQFQSLELARVGNVPPYLVGIGIPGMNYSNVQESRRDLWLFGASPYAHAITERLSMDDVLPRGRFVEFDIEDYLGTSDESPIAVEPDVPDMEID